MQILRDNLDLQTREITQILNDAGFNRTYSAVKYKFTDMRLAKQRDPESKGSRIQKIAWSDEEEQIVLNGDGKTVSELVEDLKQHGYKRTAKAVRWKLASMGLQVDGQFLGAWRKTLCWTCKHSHALGCQWHRRFRPIPGWKAIETVYTYPTKSFKGYTVLECPLFEEDKHGH